MPKKEKSVDAKKTRLTYGTSQTLNESPQNVTERKTPETHETHETPDTPEEAKDVDETTEKRSDGQTTTSARPTP